METYLNRFEGIEGDLIEHDPKLVTELEEDFNAGRLGAGLRRLPVIPDGDAAARGRGGDPAVARRHQAACERLCRRAWGPGWR